MQTLDRRARRLPSSTFENTYIHGVGQSVEQGHEALDVAPAQAYG